MAEKQKKSKNEQGNESSLDDLSAEEIGQRIEEIGRELVELSSKANQEVREGKRNISSHLKTQVDEVVAKQNRYLNKYKQLTGNSYFKGDEMETEEKEQAPMEDLSEEELVKKIEETEDEFKDLTKKAGELYNDTTKRRGEEIFIHMRKGQEADRRANNKRKLWQGYLGAYKKMIGKEYKPKK